MAPGAGLQLRRNQGDAPSSQRSVRLVAAVRPSHRNGPSVSCAWQRRHGTAHLHPQQRQQQQRRGGGGHNEESFRRQRGAWHPFLTRVIFCTRTAARRVRARGFTLRSPRHAGADTSPTPHRAASHSFADAPRAGGSASRPAGAARRSARAQGLSRRPRSVGGLRMGGAGGGNH